MSIFDKAFGKRDDEYHKDYQHDIERMRREQEAQMKRMEYDSQRQMNMAQGVIQGSGYQSGWQDPRGMMDRRAIPSRIPSVEELYENVKRANSLSKDLMHKIERTEKKVEMLTGFYTWITEVYPEIAAQHKAMRDLYEAANPTQPEKEA
jgi:hypothetical protein